MERDLVRLIHQLNLALYIRNSGFVVGRFRMWLAWRELQKEEYVRNTQKNGWAADATRDSAPLLAETGSLMGKVTSEETPSHVRRDLVRRALSRMQVFLQATFPSCSLFLSPSPSILLSALYRTPVYVIALNHLWFTLLYLLLIHNDHPTHSLQAGTKSPSRHCPAERVSCTFRINC